MKGGDHHFSLDPAETKAMVENVRLVEKSMSGFEKYLLQQEVPFRQKLAKSVATVRPVQKGEIVTRDMLVCKSPATGVSPILIERLVGKVAAHDISEDTVIRGGDVTL